MYFHPNECHAMPCIPGNEIHFGIMFKWHKKAKQQFKNPSRTASSEQAEARRNETGPLVFVPNFTIRALKHQSVEFFCYNVEYDLVCVLCLNFGFSVSELSYTTIVTINHSSSSCSFSFSFSIYYGGANVLFLPLKFSLIFLRLLKPKSKE